MRLRSLLFGTFVAASAADISLAQGPQLAPAPFNTLQWRGIGPAAFGGRFTDIVVARTRGQPDQLYIAASTGGVFKSVNGGASWVPVFDSVNSMMSMGDMAIAPSNQNIVWVGTGESANPPHRWGEGVYKSVDAGKTWAFMGLKETRHIGRVVVHPTNPDIVLVAAQGHIFGPSAERGLFKTTDGGRTWKKTLFVDENTGANDVAFDPSNPNIVFASAYQRQRKSFGGIPTGPGSGLYKSVDGGETWTKVTKGLPDMEKGRIGIFFSPVDPKLVYADVEVRGAVYPGSAGNAADCPPEGGRATTTRGGFDSGQGGVYRSLDGGNTWEHVYARIDQPSGFFIQMRADPQDRNRVYRLGTGFYVSDDMGKTFRTLNTNLHGDYFALWIDPDDNNHLIVSNDGGLAISRDRGVTWDWRGNIPVAQFYETWIDNRDPYWVCGGLQDNGMWCTPSAVRDRNGITHKEPWTMGGGDGMHVRVDPHDTTFAIFENQSGAGNQGNMQRLDLITRQRQALKPGIGRPVSCFEEQIHAAGRVVPPYRWGWDTPILFSPTTPGVVYTAANVVFKSTDRGGSWTAISPDLSTKVNRDTVFIMGRKLGAANYSPNGTNVTDPTVTPTFGQVTWLGESPLDTKVLYAGTEDGVVQVTRDGGATWTNVTRAIPNLPPFRYVSTVFPSHHVAGRVYATMEGSKSQDDKPYVYVSENYGQSWRAITNGLPNAAIWRITEHPKDPNVLVVAHVRGVHFSNDRGATWHSLNTNMPTVPVTSVVFHPRDNALVAGTYGRGIYILDDAGPLQSLTAEALRTDAVLASTTTGRQWHVFSSSPDWGVGGWSAPNPDFDASVSYFIRDGATGNATITVSDAAGATVRTLSGPAGRGLHRVTWDMRMDGAVPANAMPAGRRGGASGALGPLVLPGRYTVSVRVPGVTRELRGELQVIGDPMERISDADRRARHAATLRLYALQKQLVAARVEGQPQSLSAPLRKVQMEVNRLLGITGSQMRIIEGFSTAPTADQRQQLAWLEEDVARVMRELQRARGGSQ
ncbi:MAG TPA: hypothetical protein VEB19_07250 [Gemmatimonadaceae bacterium]|nr:hypothetical protein [Gemmatimonadaceae bacterium]